MAKRKSGTGTTDNMLAALQQSQDSLARVGTELSRPRRGSFLRKNKQIAKILDRVEDVNTKSHRVGVDLAGGGAAQVSTEFLNWIIRATANWAGKDSWMGKNVDILQGAPHFLIGLAVYFTELLTRKNGELPSMTREIASEAANVFTHLGFANLARALRIRWADGKVDASTLAKVTAERDAAIAKLAGTAK